MIRIDTQIYDNDTNEQLKAQRKMIRNDTLIYDSDTNHIKNQEYIPSFWHYSYLPLFHTDPSSQDKYL